MKMETLGLKRGKQLTFCDEHFWMKNESSARERCALVEAVLQAAQPANSDKNRANLTNFSKILLPFVKKTETFITFNIGNLRSLLRRWCKT